jgi:TPR repeat protein
MTEVEAQMYAISLDMIPVGSIYQIGDDIPFSILIQAKKEDSPIVNLNFDLAGVYEAVRMEFSGEDKGADFSPFTLIGLLAKQNDPAAQAAIGAFLANEDRIEDAIGWLRASSRRGNLLANSLLARIFWKIANTATDPEAREAALDEVMENYLHAIGLGSADSMYALGVLYLNNNYGEENKPSGVTLLKQAAQMNYSDAAMFLAHLHYAGEVVDKDLGTARDYYAQASELDNSFAQRSYARFLLDPEADQESDPRVADWLEGLAREDDDAEAMLLLGNLHARGVGVKQNFRKAVGWFKDAVKVSPENASIVNEVAWTLTVSDLQGLKRKGYALSIMDTLMDNNEAARRRPEYLDTWAAAYAANGDFDRAISVQEEALTVAEAPDFEDVRDILREHLDAFRDQQTITERAP